MTRHTDANDWLRADTEEARAIRYLTEQTDVSPNQAKDIVRQHGVERGTILQVAHTRKAEG